MQRHRVRDEENEKGEAAMMKDDRPNSCQTYICLLSKSNQRLCIFVCLLNPANLTHAVHFRAHSNDHAPVAERAVTLLPVALEPENCPLRRSNPTR